MADYEDMNDLDECTPLDFDLYYISNHEAALQAGAVKSYGVKEGGSAIYDRRESGYTVTVERLLWVDGWEKTTMNGEQRVRGQEMTLVVLKIVLASHDPNRRFAYVKASLTFEDSNYEKTHGKNEPVVEAWAPFRTQERWNPSVANLKKTDTKDGKLEVGYSGVGLSGGWGIQGEINWDRTAFDQGRSNSESSRITGNRNGVTWVLEQNQLENAGVSQEFWAAVIVSRPTVDPYLVKFQIETQIGTIENSKQKLKEFFGFNPSKTRPFRVTPWSKRVCNFEGKDIIKSIDLDNLGKLRGLKQSTELDVKWGPNYKIDISTPAEQASELSKDNIITGESAEDVSPASTSRSASLTTPALPVPISDAAAASPITLPSAASGLLQVPQSSLPPLMIGWYNPTPTTNTESGRLTALEARAAQTESRIAAQDSLLLQLQQDLIAKNLQLARLEQLINSMISG
ncbi:MAG: hypothetical protein Q9211_001151 [Gyalolechia sp. 1 TL-2023]